MPVSVSRSRHCIPIPCVWFDRHRRVGSRDEWVKMAEDVRAEIVASVLEVVVTEGDQIGEGDILVLLESMKM